MKSESSFFKSLSPLVALSISMFCGASFLYFSNKLIPIFFQVTNLINEGVAINATGAIAIGLLFGTSIFTYFLGLGSHLSYKRVVEAIYD